MELRFYPVDSEFGAREVFVCLENNVVGCLV
jgi:hypothetical protein